MTGLLQPLDKTHAVTPSIADRTAARLAVSALGALLAGCATGHFPQPVEFRGASSATPAQRAEILWALQPYVVAASGCDGAITGIDAMLNAKAPAAAAPDPAAHHELWIVYLCTTALPVTVSLRPQPDGRLDFAFDRTR